MSRSKWKGPFINKKFSENLIVLIQQNNNKIITTTSRSTEIISSFIGLVFEIHTGKTFFKLEITENMVGYKLGEFAFTRTHSLPKKKNKKKIIFKKTIKNGTKS